MKGSINRAIHDMIIEQHGQTIWEQICREAEMDEPMFVASGDYDDSVTVQLVMAAAKVLELEPEIVMYEFGRYWIMVAAPRTYPMITAMAGGSTKALLTNIHCIHRTVTSSIENSRPPSLPVEELPDGRLRMRYDSERGLCHVLRGLIVGAGELFEDDVTVEETTCMHHGHDCCTMDIRIAA